MFVLKVMCLFLAILLTYSNTLNWASKFRVSGIKVIIQVAGITGFIVLQWLL